MLILTKHKRFGRYTFMTITDGKKIVDINHGPTGVNVCMQNAAHQAWKGMGKHFESFAEAANAYKSSFMRNAIEYASEII
jgi:hypothetical protein